MHSNINSERFSKLKCLLSSLDPTYAHLDYTPIHRWFIRVKPARPRNGTSFITHLSYSHLTQITLYQIFRLRFFTFPVLPHYLCYQPTIPYNSIELKDLPLRDPSSLSRHSQVLNQKTTGRSLLLSLSTPLVQAPPSSLIHARHE